MLPYGSIPTKFFRWRRTPRQKKAFRNASLRSKAAYPDGFLLPLSRRTANAGFAGNGCAQIPNRSPAERVRFGKEKQAEWMSSAACGGAKDMEPVSTYAMPAVMMAIL